MVQVLKDFGMASLKLTQEDFTKKNFFTQLGYEPLRIDILNVWIVFLLSKRGKIKK